MAKMNIFSPADDNDKNRVAAKLKRKVANRPTTPQRPEIVAPAPAKGKGLYKRGEGLGTGPVGSAKEVSKPTTPGNTITRPAGNNLRRPSAGLNPVKPATQTQSRRKTDLWDDLW